jgi:uncharacterized lipoprotein
VNKLLIIGFLVALLLSACSGAATNQEVASKGDSQLVTVYRAPT